MKDLEAKEWVTLFSLDVLPIINGKKNQEKMC